MGSNQSIPAFIVSEDDYLELRRVEQSPSDTESGIRVNGEIESVPNQDALRYRTRRVSDYEKTWLEIEDKLLRLQVNETSSNGQGAVCTWDKKDEKVLVPSDDEGEKLQTSTKLQVYNSSGSTAKNDVLVGDFGAVLKAITEGRSIPQLAVQIFHVQFDKAKTTADIGIIDELKPRNVAATLGILHQPKDFQSVITIRLGVTCPYFPDGNIVQLVSLREKGVNFATISKLLKGVAEGCEYLRRHGVVFANPDTKTVPVERSEDTTVMLTDNNAMKVENGLIVPIRHLPAQLLVPRPEEAAFQSDVWKFGVLISQAFSKGAAAHGKRNEATNIQLVGKTSVAPYDITAPQSSSRVPGCSSGMMEIMNSTSEPTPNERPAFTEVNQDIAIEQPNAEFQAPIPEKESSGDSAFDEQWDPPSVDSSGSLYTSRRGDYRRRPPNQRRGPRSTGYKGRKPPQSNSSSPTVDDPTKTSSAARSLSEPMTCASSAGSSDKSDSNTTPTKYKQTRKLSALAPRFTRKYESRAELSSSNSGHQTLSALSGDTKTGMPPPPLMSVTPPPPPYSALPRSSLRSPRGRTTLSSNRAMFSNRSESVRPHRQIDFDREIERKTQELEQLKVRKLQQEASITWSKMQSLVSQITKLHANTSGGPSGSQADRRGRSDTSQRYEEYDLGSTSSFNHRGNTSRSSQSSRGVRSRGRGTRGGAKFCSRYGVPRSTDDTQ